MDRQQTSFIPKRSLAPEARPLVTAAPFRLAPFLSLLVLLSGVLLSGGIFLYDRLLTATLQSKKDTLERNLSAFEPATIKEIQRLDKRLRSTKAIINEHVALSNVFTILERSTLPTVQFLNFEYVADGEGGLPFLSMEGIARSYGSVVNQSDTFNTTKGLLQPVFTDINLDQDGNVTFAFDANLDEEVVRYAFVVPLESSGGATNSDEAFIEELTGEDLTESLEEDLQGLDNLEDL